MKRSEARFAEVLQSLIDEAGDDEGSVLHDVRVRSFDEVGVLTHNAGIVVKLPDGSEFQVTVVESRKAKDNGVGTETESYD